MLTFHYYSNNFGVRLESIDEQEEEEEYALDKIKEFEEIDPVWQEALNAMLQGIEQITGRFPEDIRLNRMLLPFQ